MFQLPSSSAMGEVRDSAVLDMNGVFESSFTDMSKTPGKSRSRVWQHFLKITKEDGTCDKCQCNHCHKVFTCSSRSGTTHLLRHISDGICPSFKNCSPSWKFDQEIAQNSSVLEPQPILAVEDDSGSHTHLRRIQQKPVFKSRPRTEEAWVSEFRSCVAKLTELTNGEIPVGLACNTSGYSISAALRCLNEMDDVPQTSEMYLDAFEILHDAEERECFICLPPEPRRRWLQRMLHRRHPLRYSSNI